MGDTHQKAKIDWGSIKHPEGGSMFLLTTWYPKLHQGNDAIQTAIKSQELFTSYEDAHETWMSARDTDKERGDGLLCGLLSTLDEIADGRWATGTVHPLD